MTLDSSQPVGTRLAAIDVGTNSIRLIVAEVENDGTYRVLDEEREMTRLGRGLSALGRLSDEAMERSLDAIGKMKAISDGFQVRELRAIATSAVRESVNGRAFCREAARRHHLSIEVISSDEEARLAFRSVVKNFNLEGRAAAIVDIGGGSTEVILAAGTVIDRIHSLSLGAICLSERYCLSDPLRPKHRKRLRKEIHRVINRGIGKPSFTADCMVGSGGTFCTLADMVQCQRSGRTGPVQGYLMTRTEIVRLLDRLLEMPLETRRQLPGLNPARADIIIAGVAVVERIADVLGCNQILVNDRGIRDGLLQSMIGDQAGRQMSDPAPAADRMDAVRLLAQKCRSNQQHCQHVARLADMMFDELCGRFNLPPAGREILLAAAWLHETGYLIHFSQHHKHAYHLIMHGELPGFSAREIELIANVARYHRRALPKKSHNTFRRLDRPERRLVRQLAGILRVANSLDRTHSQSVTGLRCESSNGLLRLVVEGASDPQVEIWDAERNARLFENAFDARLELVWRADLDEQTALPLRPLVPEESQRVRA